MTRRRLGNGRPVIGVTAGVETARWGAWELVATLLPHRYVEQLAAAGGRAVLLPPDLESDSDGGADVLMERLDGLILAGGVDLDPAWYGAERHPATVGVNRNRDASEFALLTAALTQNLPVLGICRGMELMAVGQGGRLHQHLPEVVGHDGHRPAPGSFGNHAVELAPASRLAGLLGERVTVPSYHHQGVAETGTAVAVGWAEDGSVEAIELPGYRFAFGVLWHPEAGDDRRLFIALVAAASGRG